MVQARQWVVGCWCSGFLGRSSMNAISARDTRQSSSGSASGHMRVASGPPRPVIKPRDGLTTSPHEASPPVTRGKLIVAILNFGKTMVPSPTAKAVREAEKPPYPGPQAAKLWFQRGKTMVQVTSYISCQLRERMRKGGAQATHVGIAGAEDLRALLLHRGDGQVVSEVQVARAVQIRGTMQSASVSYF